MPEICQPDSEPPPIPSLGDTMAQQLSHIIRSECAEIEAEIRRVGATAETHEIQRTPEGLRLVRKAVLGHIHDCAASGFYTSEKPGYTVTLRRESDGTIGHYRQDDYPFSHFQWGDGNDSCDCARHLRFQEALGVDGTDADWGYPCGETRYTVLRVVCDDGTVIERDPRGE